MTTRAVLEQSAVENVKKALKNIAQHNKQFNALLQVNEQALEQAEQLDASATSGLLKGLTIAVKSNISVQDMTVSCGSKTLEGYNGLYDADVIRKIKEQDGIIIGMANCDEFGCGSSGEYSAFGATQNPNALGKIPGGSSSGSAAAVAAGFCDIALGSDTGGSIRNPASHCGVIGIKPSYGRVSRYGLVDMAMSLEQIGVLSNNTLGSALMMETIAGQSRRDARTIATPVPRYSTIENKKLVIGLCDELKALCTDERIYTHIEEQAMRLADACGGSVKKIKLEHIPLAVQTYYPIVFVEFFSATRKFDGRTYGKKIESSCGSEVLRRIEGGREISRAEYNGRYYAKALQIKQLITASFNKAFKNVDVIALPVTPSLPHNIGSEISPEHMYAYDAFTTPANLAGICGVSVPSGKIDNIPVGLQLLAPKFKEQYLFSAMSYLENA